MGVVDFTFYSTVYKGSEAIATSFPALDARAEDVIGAITRWAVDETTIQGLPELTQTLYKKAVCAEIDFVAINGAETITAGSGEGFTVGKVHVEGKQGINASKANSVSPLALQYLEQTGLLYPGVPAVIGWW